MKDKMIAFLLDKANPSIQLREKKKSCTQSRKRKSELCRSGYWEKNCSGSSAKSSRIPVLPRQLSPVSVQPLLGWGYGKCIPSRRNRWIPTGFAAYRMALHFLQLLFVRDSGVRPYGVRISFGRAWKQWLHGCLPVLYSIGAGNVNHNK